MKEISSMDFPQHGEVIYFYGQAFILLFHIQLTQSQIWKIKLIWTASAKCTLEI
jgi:hypothetical protein